MPRVGIREQYRVRKVLAQRVRIRHRNHFVVDSAHDERRLTDVLQIGEARARELLPFAKRSHLGSRHMRTRHRFEILFTLCKPVDERLPCCLT